MLWIALAAQLSAPMPTNLDKWFGYGDVPSYLVEQGNGFWQVGIRAEVAPDGKIRNCGVQNSSGIQRLDTLTCAIVLRRAKFQPASWVDGSPVFGTYKTSVSWAVSETGGPLPRVSNPDLDLIVNQLPPDAKSPSLVRIMFAVDPQGAISSCVAEPGKNFELAENNSALVPVACDQVVKNYKPEPARDATGKPIPSVQDAQVRFSVQQR